VGEVDELIEVDVLVGRRVVDADDVIQSVDQLDAAML